MPIKNIGELGTNNLRRKALETLNTAIISLNPKNAVKEYAQTITKDFPENSNLHVFGFGKAAENMYLGLREVFSGSINSAILIIPEDEDFSSEFRELRVLRGTHPFPSDLTVDSSKLLLREVEKCDPDDQLIFLISGGGSALFEIPAEGIAISEIARISECIMDSGAAIDELNTVRIAMSSVKGGKLLDKIRSKSVHALYISDVISNDLLYIASGPLVPYSERPGDVSVFERFRNCFGNSTDQIMSGRKHLQQGRTEVNNRVVLSNEDFVSFIARKLETDRSVLNLGHTLHGDVEQVSRNILSRLRSEGGKRKTDFWFVGAGESTVNVKGGGTGGRNQELCLHVLRNLRSEEKVLFISAGTDGIDGNSPAMGGIVDHETLEDSSVNEMEEYVYRNDSHSFLSEHNGAIMSGRTGNNVSDIILGHYATWNNRY